MKELTSTLPFFFRDPQAATLPKRPHLNPYDGDVDGSILPRSILLSATSLQSVSVFRLQGLTVGGSGPWLRVLEGLKVYGAGLWAALSQKF